jgi:hypothetical protein
MCEELGFYDPIIKNRPIAGEKEVRKLWHNEFANTDERGV